MQYNIAYESKQKRTGTICISPFLFVSSLILQSKLDNTLIFIHKTIPRGDTFCCPQYTIEPFFLTIF